MPRFLCSCALPTRHWHAPTTTAAAHSTAPQLCPSLAERAEANSAVRLAGTTCTVITRQIAAGALPPGEASRRRGRGARRRASAPSSRRQTDSVPRERNAAATAAVGRTQLPHAPCLRTRARRPLRLRPAGGGAGLCAQHRTRRPPLHRRAILLARHRRRPCPPAPTRAAAPPLSRSAAAKKAGKKRRKHVADADMNPEELERRKRQRERQQLALQLRDKGGHRARRAAPPAAPPAPPPPPAPPCHPCTPPWPRRRHVPEGAAEGPARREQPPLKGGQAAQGGQEGQEEGAREAAASSRPGRRGGAHLLEHEGGLLRALRVLAGGALAGAGRRAAGRCPGVPTTHPAPLHTTPPAGDGARRDLRGEPQDRGDAAGGGPAGARGQGHAPHARPEDAALVRALAAELRGCPRAAMRCAPPARKAQGAAACCSSRGRHAGPAATLCRHVTRPRARPPVRPKPCLACLGPCREEKQVRVRVEVGPKEAALGTAILAIASTPGQVAHKVTLDVDERLLGRWAAPWRCWWCWRCW
jgi:hypothetical protein